ncbi:MAG: hypothetical protein QME52_00925 [Bacteroidota bacterium]|nr:hypothetical protein [Bacteroidota bacterium]
MDTIITLCSPCSVFIPLLFGILRYGKLEKDLRIVVIFLGFETLFLISAATTVLMGYRNLWTIHFYTIIEYIFLIAIFSQWQRNLLIRRLMFFSIPLIIVIAIFDISQLENLNMFNVFTRPISSILMISVLGITLFELNKGSAAPISRNPRFWIIPPVFISTTTGVLIFAVGNYLWLNFPTTFSDIYRIMLFIGILSNFFYLGVFLCPSQQQTSGG